MERAETAEAKFKKLEMDSMLKDQELVSLQHKVSNLETDLETAEKKISDSKVHKEEEESNKSANENLNRKIALLESELDNAEKNLRETTDKLRQVDVKAEHFERQVQRIESERDSWEKKWEETQEKYIASKRELEEVVQAMEISTMKRSAGLRAHLGLLLISTIDVLAGSPPISVSIQATWQEPPILIQVLESAALERPSLFFPSIDAVCSDWENSKSKLSTDKQKYEYLTSLLGSPGLLDGPGGLESLAFSVALKEAQPKIEAFRAWYASLPSNLTGELDSTDQCQSWTLINDSKICNPSELSELLDSNNFSENNFTESSRNLKSFPSIISTSYTKPPQSSRLRLLHIFRWKIPSGPLKTSSKSQSASLLSGWGASLDIKKSEYLTLDDRPVESSSSDDTQLIIDGTSATENLADSEQAKLKPLKAAEIFDIGAKATQHVLSSPSPLSALRKLTEDFPLVAHTLVNEWVPGRISTELRLELKENMANSIPPGQSVIWMNGLQISSLVSLENLNLFKLVEIMRNERRWIGSLSSLGLNSLQARNLIIDEKLNSAMNPEASSGSAIGEIDASSLGVRFDASDRQEGGGAIIWLNDLENDPRYSMWPSTLRAILRPTFPGQLHPIGRNLINVVLGLDLTQTQNLHTLGHVIEAFITRTLPIRWGIVPIPTKDPSEGEKISRSFWDMTEALGPMEALKFIKEFTQNLEEESRKIDIKKFVIQANERVSNENESSSKDIKSDQDEKFKIWLNKSQLYSSRLSLCSNDHSLPACMLINGRFFPMEENYRSHLQETATLHTGFIQHQVYYNLLKDDQNVADYLYDLPLVHRARNDLVFPSEARPLKFVIWSKLFNLLPMFLRQIRFSRMQMRLRAMPNRAPSHLMGSWKSRFQGWDKGSMHDVSVQVSFVHTPSDNSETPTELSSSLAELITASVDAKITTQDVIDQLSRHEYQITVSDDGSPTTPGSDIPVARHQTWLGTHEFARTIGVKSDDGLAIIINGRLVHVSSTTKLLNEDLTLLVEYETQQRINPLMEALKTLDEFDLNKYHSNLPLIMSTVGVVLVGSDDGSSQTSSSEARSAKHLSRIGTHSSYQHGDKENALFEFSVILNPPAKLLNDDVSMKVWFNPSLELNELPIKRFFRTAISNSLEFDKNGRAIPALVNFDGIPTETLFTLAIDTPPAWLALPHDSIHDLDNIMLSELLLHLLRNQEVDTIIMANLGYFQFKSSPGIHRLSIRPGRSLELYQFEKTDSSLGIDDDEPYQFLCLTTFNGLTIYPRVRKRPDKISESLIQPLSASSTSSKKGPVGEFSKLMGQVKDLASGMLRGQGSDLANGTSRSVINVFTVASGLLYERMAYLMCSGSTDLKRLLKFLVWFISNFLSPSFKRFIPHLAKEYGFDYQLVTYRWPSWLRAQKEKQRVIWGYKILFLDVLFPLEVDRVIFVDSDQIVRTDLKDLYELDLEGAPYAYAPMCNDRNETKGFRFWDTGYWKESLQGRPYHISALYVVDLRVFRTIAAGDQLRQHYQSLSADPGSLANLDQDLPNNMQSILPIYTLDQSWLWCETWCSDEGLKTAKTIDLCNNPLTHEPKLKRARRLIPEWDTYDQEVAALASRIKKNLNEDDSSAKITVQAGLKIDDEDLNHSVHQKDDQSSSVLDRDEL
ncbi:hypothetical protein PSTT_06979 [Puccinia striiformis]|uniref:UDP-glucose:glycoprotein glucosyltransferase n=1 Tax=Puccinia striiformis TaxID=27350 RepID=A0A2S4VIE9_9BASI|nr:hypothetical protein PSTT_06979 [Puccinia striiformis]